jgi:hypothetical protein
VATPTTSLIRATLSRVDAPALELARSLCEHLAGLSGVVYAALERQGAATLCEAGDRRALVTGPVKSHLAEELVVVAPRLVLRVVYDEARWNPDLFSHVESARTTLRLALRGAAPLPPSNGGAPPASPAPAEVGAHDGARKRWN